MRFGMVLPGGMPREQVEQAILAEQAGWDGVFVWEAAYGVDAWSLLAAIAVRTTRIRLGTMLTPLPWRRPWKVASQVATLDQLSAGRAILTVGMGALTTDLPLTSMRRVLRCDGLVPQFDLGDREGAPDDVRAVRTWLAENGGRSDLDIVAEGETPADDPITAEAQVRPWTEAGCTWWLETRWEMPHHSADRMAQVRQRLTAGPPAPGRDPLGTTG
jgi:hypothetical protein